MRKCTNKNSNNKLNGNAKSSIVDIKIPHPSPLKRKRRGLDVEYDLCCINGTVIVLDKR